MALSMIPNFVVAAMVCLVSFSWSPAEDKSTEDGVVTVEPVSAAAPGDPDLEAGARHFQQVCAQCHGTKGEGKVELKAPSIANLPDWYVAIQIGKFQRHWRGVKPEDVPGIQMHAIAQSLDAVAVRDLSGYIRSLEIVPTKVTLEGGVAERGAELFRERCMECHRYNGRGEAAFRSGQLIGLQDWYIVSQLAKFRDGMRGHNEDDVEGAKMHRVAERMTDQAFLDLAAHIAELAERYKDERPRRSR